RVLTRVTPLDLHPFDPFDQVVALVRITVTVPFRPTEKASPLAHTPAPIGDHVALLGGCRRLKDKNLGVRSPARIVPVLTVPVRQEHYHNLQTVEFLRAYKWVLIVSPALLVAQLLYALRFSLETRLGKTSVRIDVLLGPAELDRPANSSPGHEIT